MCVDQVSPPREAYATNAMYKHMYVGGAGHGVRFLLSAPPPWGGTL